MYFVGYFIMAVANVLMDLSEERGDGTLYIPEKLTQQDIADRVGASREMVARILKDLTIGEYIGFEGRNIVINGKHDITIKGCGDQSEIIADPATASSTVPVIGILGSQSITISNLKVVASMGQIGILVDDDVEDDLHGLPAPSAVRAAGEAHVDVSREVAPAVPAHVVDGDVVRLPLTSTPVPGNEQVPVWTLNDPRSVVVLVVKWKDQFGAILGPLGDQAGHTDSE